MAKMLLRIDDGQHRQTTWLELFFDLAFVICVANLTHLLVNQHDLNGFLVYISLFIPIWWIWNQFTWYASHFDNDDANFRFFLLMGIFGTLLLTRGLHDFQQGDLSLFIGGYIFLHLIMAAAWVRAYREILEYRSYIKFKFTGTILGIVFWIAAYYAQGNLQYILCALGLLLQLSMPILAWAKVQKMISIHQHHLLERHGLFVMILLGECLLSLSKRFAENHIGILEFILFLIILFEVWWIYFDWKYNPINLQKISYAFAFNYGHFFIYASLGILAAAMALEIEKSYLINLASAIFLLALSIMNLLSHREVNRRRPWIWITLAFILLITTFLSPGITSLSVVVLVLLGTQFTKN